MPKNKDGGGKLIILDWSLPALNNSVFDVGFIYLITQAIPRWQEEFLKAFLNFGKDSKKFKFLLRIDTISLANRFAAQCYYLRLRKNLTQKYF